jgi:hypothetical protein
MRDGLERALADLQSLAAIAVTEDAIHACRSQLERYFRDPPMVDGAVVPPALWAEVRPAFDALRDQLVERSRQAVHRRADDAAARHRVTLRLWYRAQLYNFETDEADQQLASAQRCVGAREHTGWEDSHAFGAPVLTVPIDAVVVHDGEHGLRVVIEIALARQPESRELEAILGTVQTLMFSGWGTNYQFEIPEDLADQHRVSFDSDPIRHEVVPRT